MSTWTGPGRPVEAVRKAYPHGQYLIETGCFAGRDGWTASEVFMHGCTVYDAQGRTDRGHRLGRPGIEVLELVPGLKTVDSHATCCGIAGTYGYKKEKYDIAMQVGQPLFDFVNELGAPLVICDSETCRWQITHATGKPAIHPVELLAAAYGLPVEGALDEVLQSMAAEHRPSAG